MKTLLILLTITLILLTACVPVEPTPTNCTEVKVNAMVVTDPQGNYMIYTNNSLCAYYANGSIESCPEQNPDFKVSFGYTVLAPVITGMQR